MADITERHILDALRAVIDQERGADIVSLSMVQGVIIKDGNVQIAIEVDPVRGPKLEPLRRAAEAAVERLAGVTSVTAVLTAQRATGSAPPPSARDSRAGHDHGRASSGAAGPKQPAKPQKAMVPGVRSIIAVASGKGGVGKSTTAVNLACAFAQLGLATGLLDADVYGPSQPRMLGISGKPTSLDGKILQPMENYGVRCMSIGFLMEEDAPVIWRGPMVMSALQQMLRDVAWGELDVLVVDLPPGTGDAQLTMAQTVPLTGAVIVSTPQDIALLDARKGLNMFRKVDVPVLGIIENMSYFVCPHCGERAEIFSHGGARREAESLAVPFLGEIPLHLAIRETSDAGTPIVMAAPHSEHAHRYLAIAENLWETVSGMLQAPQRLPPKIIIE